MCIEEKLLKKTPKQLQALLILRKKSLFSNTIFNENISLYIIRKLCQKKLCKEYVYFKSIVNCKSFISTKKIFESHLNFIDQSKLQTITKINHKFRIFVLTINSKFCKEETYYFLLGNILQKGLKILFLVPDVDFAILLFSLLKKRLDVPIDLYHSDLSETKKLTLWEKCQNQNSAIIITTPLGIFLPISNLGMIILEEENNLLYKIKKKWTFNVKNLAIMRAYKEHIPIVLEGNELSLETLHNIEKKKFKLIEIFSINSKLCFKNINQKLIYISSEKSRGIFSIYLIKKLQNFLKQKKTVCLIIDNLYKMLTLLKCHICGTFLQCTYCNEYYEFNIHSQELYCKYCLYKKVLPPNCIFCNSLKYTPVNFDMCLLEENIKKIFFNVCIVHVKKNVITHTKSLSRNKVRLKNNTPSIIIGKSEWIKKCNINKICCVVFLCIDVYLYTNDFRSTERLGQLYFSIIRKISNFYNIHVTVLIQTKVFKNYLLEKLVQSCYKSFALELLQIRKNNKLPPFTRHIVIEIESKNYKLLSIFSKKYYDYLINNFSSNTNNKLWVVKSDIIFLKRYCNNFLVTMLLAYPSQSFLKKISRNSTNVFSKFCTINKIQLIFDMDPI